MKPKLNNVSLLRLIATLSIFIFHFLLMFTHYDKKVFPFYFAVQVFFFISGFLYANKKIDNIKNFYIKNFIKIVVPAIVFVGLYFMTLGIISVITGTPVNFIIYEASLSGERMMSFAHLWYLYAILLCYLILPFLHMLFNPEKSKLLKVIIIAILSLLIIGNTFLGMLGAQAIFLSFVIGFLFKKLTSSKEINGKSKALYITFSLIIFAIGCAIYAPFSIMAILPFGFDTLFRELAVVFIGCGFAIFFILTFEFLNKFEKLAKLLKNIDKYCFTFYFIHNIVIVCGGGISLNLISPYLALNFFIMLVATIILCIPVNYFSNLMTEKALSIEWRKKSENKKDIEA